MGIKASNSIRIVSAASRKAEIDASRKAEIETSQPEVSSTTLRWSKETKIFIDAESARSYVPLLQPGDRVSLVNTSDPYTKLKPGTLGTIRYIDGLSTIHVEWEDGSNLGLVAEEDTFHLLLDTKKDRSRIEMFITPL